MNKNQKERLEKKYTYSEFLSEFFPNVDPEEEKKKGENFLSEDQFFDILTKASAPIPSTSEKGKKGTSE